MYHNELTNIIAGIKHHLQSCNYNGIDHIPCPENILSSLPLSLEQLENKLSTCRRCNLSQTGKRTVFGKGKTNASLLFVGDIPVEEEAGKLLTRIIEAIKLTRDTVYVCNVIKCRPPLNRQPNDYEIAACKGFLFKQIELIQPKIICALGSLAGQVLLRSELPLSKLRGKFHTVDSFNNINVIVTYHPRYLLEHPEKKILAWEDMKMLKARLKLLLKQA
ncbi:MAG: uracil-DNA glycosylase [bacterium]